jgi:ABC-type transport system involved in multi-copper enzyme maturation permease subunit
MRFLNLVRWEIEEYLSLPVLAFLIGSAIIATLAQTNINALPGNDYVNLYFGSSMVFTVLTLVAGAFFSRSFAGSIGRGETKLMLSYPIKRNRLFLSKLTAMFLPILVIYCTTYLMHVYLDNLGFFEPMLYVTLSAFILQLMMACAISVAISMVTKSEIMSVVASVFLLLGIDSIAGSNSYLSGQGRFQSLFQYFGGITHGSLPFGDKLVVSPNDIVIAVLIPVLIFLLLIVLSFVYFTIYMEVD